MDRGASWKRSTPSPSSRSTPSNRSFSWILLPEWLAERQHAVSRKTYVADAALRRLAPPALAGLQVGAVTDREVTRALIALNQSGLAESSVGAFGRPCRRSSPGRCGSG